MVITTYVDGKLERVPLVCIVDARKLRAARQKIEQEYEAARERNRQRFIMWAIDAYPVGVA